MVRVRVRRQIGMIPMLDSGVNAGMDGPTGPWTEATPNVLTLPGRRAGLTRHVPMIPL